MRRANSRGFTVTELVVATSISLLCFLGLARLVKTSHIAFNAARSEDLARERLAQAVGRMEGTLRNTLRVDLANTTATKLTVILPDVEAATRALLRRSQGRLSAAE